MHASLIQFDEGSKCEPDSARAKALMRGAYNKLDEYVHVDRWACRGFSRATTFVFDFLATWLQALLFEQDDH